MTYGDIKFCNNNNIFIRPQFPDNYAKTASSGMIQ